MNEQKPTKGYTHCLRCDRKLHTEKSRVDGYGPTCNRKRLIEGTQLKIQDFLVDA